MGGCFSCQRCRLPEAEEKKEAGEAQEDVTEVYREAQTPPPPGAGEACPPSIRSSAHPAGLVALAPESVPEAALPLEALEQRLGDLRELQRQYLQGQLRVRRLCQLFPRALRTLSLQICHARRRLIRVEVRLRRQGGGPGEGLPALPASAPAHEPLLSAASACRGLLAVGSSVSSFSLPLPPFPPPPLRPDPGDPKAALEALVQLQAHHLHDRKRDLRGCQECLRSLRALRAQLRNVRNRLWVLEAQLGIQVPPRELDADEPEEEEAAEEEEPGVPLGGPGTSTAEPEEART